MICRVTRRPVSHLAAPPEPAGVFEQRQQACKAQIVGRGIDPDADVIGEIADDVNDLRKALGHDRIVLRQACPTAD